MYNTTSIQGSHLGRNGSLCITLRCREVHISAYAHRVANWTTYADPELRKGRSGRPFRRWRAQVLSPAVLVCCRCGHQIDKRLSGNHPDGPTADHYPIPLSRWGGPLDPRNGAPAHRRCNLSAQNRMPDEVPQRPVRVADRRW